MTAHTLQRSGLRARPIERAIFFEFGQCWQAFSSSGSVGRPFNCPPRERRSLTPGTIASNCAIAIYENTREASSGFNLSALTRFATNCIHAVSVSADKSRGEVEREQLVPHKTEVITITDTRSRDFTLLPVRGRWTREVGRVH